MNALGIALPPAFPTLPTAQDDLQHSRLICLLVALAQALRVDTPLVFRTITTSKTGSSGSEVAPL